MQHCGVTSASQRIPTVQLLFSSTSQPPPKPRPSSAIQTRQRRKPNALSILNLHKPGLGCYRNWMYGCPYMGSNLELLINSHTGSLQPCFLSRLQKCENRRKDSAFGELFHCCGGSLTELGHSHLYVEVISADADALMDLQWL